MAPIILLLLSFFVLFLVGLSVLRLLALHALAGREGRQPTVDFPNPTRAIDGEIARLQDRLDEFDHTGGSGTWMAIFAASYLRRRVADLKRQRSWHFREARRWWLRRAHPAAVRLPQPRGCANADIRKRRRE